MVEYRLEAGAGLEDCVLNQAQRQIASHRRGALLVLGGPRTGKTTALGEAAVSGLRQGIPHVVFFTESRRARLDLRSRLAVTWSQSPSSLTVTTLHSFCLSVVRDFDQADTTVLSAARQDHYISAILAGQPDNAWPARFGPARSTRQFAVAVREAVAACQRCGLSADDVMAQAMAAGRDDWVCLAWFYREYLDILGLASVLDYPDLLVRAQGLLREASVLDRVRPPGSLIIIDAIEDMDPVQASIVSRLVDRTTPVILATDPDCAVFGFRGAKTRSATEMVRQWSEAGIETTTIALRQGYEVARAVEAACVNLRERIPLPGGLPADQLDAYRKPWPDRDGHAVCVVCDDEWAEAEQAAQILKQAHLLERVPYQDMAVLVRKKTDFERFALACRRAGVPMAISGDEIQLNRERIVTLVTAALSAVIGPDPDGGPPAGEEVVCAGRARLSGSVVDVLWAIWEAADWQNQLLEQIEAGGGDAVIAHRALDGVVALFDLAGQFSDLAAEAGIVALMEAVQAQEIPDDLARSSTWTTAAVRLTTAHRAKGQSWALVIVAGVNEGTWPGDTSPSALLALDGLSDDMSPPDRKQHLAAERRLLYTACSCASARLVVTAVADGETRPSRLFSQIAAATASNLQQPPDQLELSAAGLVGRLRTLAADETTEPGLRQAACDRLARLSGNRLFPGAHPDQWWSLGRITTDQSIDQPDDFVISASQLDSLLSCPRRWFLTHRVHSDRPVNVAAQVGSAIHAVLKDPAASLEQMTQKLRQAWEDLSFPSAWMSRTQWEAAIAALSRHDQLRRVNSRQVLASEVDVRFGIDIDAIGPVTIQGRIDRLERDRQQRIWVVDHKTGKQSPTRKQVLSNAQLGLYQLGITAGALESVTGPAALVAGAELVYLSIAAGKGSQLPKVLSQSSIQTSPHLSLADQSPLPIAAQTPEVAPPEDHPSWVHHRIAVAAALIRQAKFPGLTGGQCRGCAFLGGCGGMASRLGRS